MTKWKKVLLFFCFASLIICGCNHEDIQQKAVTEFNGSIGSHQKFMYDIFTRRLGIYNTDKLSWEPLSEGNLFQYPFQEDNKYYTCGNSLEGKYCIIEITKNHLKTIYKMYDKKRILPLVKYNNNYYYKIIEMKDSGEKQFSIAVLENRVMKELFKTDKIISNGVQIEGVLYYTVYEKQKELYDLYKVDLKEEQLSGECIKEDLADSELYVHNKQLYLSSTNKIYNEDEEFSKKDFNYFLEDENILFQIDINKNEYFITDLETKEAKKGNLSIINFEINGSKLVLYAKGKVKKIELPKN